MSNWIVVPTEHIPATEYTGWGKDRVINLDQVIEVALSTKGDECFIHCADGSEMYITGATALPFYQECLRKAFRKDGE